MSTAHCNAEKLPEWLFPTIAPPPASARFVCFDPEMISDAGAPEAQKKEELADPLRLALELVNAGYATAPEIGQILHRAPKTIIGRLYTLAQRGLIRRVPDKDITRFYPIDYKDTPIFSVGDQVSWTTKSATLGFVERSGTVCQVVPAGEFPDAKYSSAGAKAIKPRTVESYVIDIGPVKRCVTRYYWPHAETLERAE